jgi:hypothetical protein
LVSRDADYNTSSTAAPILIVPPQTPEGVGLRSNEISLPIRKARATIAKAIRFRFP